MIDRRLLLLPLLLAGLLVADARGAFVASYPSAVKAFTTKLTGATIQASHVNDLQDEVTAVENGLLNGLAHHTGPSVDSSFNLGSNAVRWATAFADVFDAGPAGLTLRDSDSSHRLLLTAGSNLTADRAVTITTGDAPRTLTISADTTLGAGWTTPAFAAGDYTGNGAMTWTVAAGDVTTLAYAVTGKILTVAFYLDTTTVGGVLNNNLLRVIPGGFTATKTIRASAYLIDNGAPSDVLVTVFATGTSLVFQRADGANFAASANNTHLSGQITIEID